MYSRQIELVQGPARLEIEQHALLQLRLAVVDGDGVVVPVEAVDQRLQTRGDTNMCDKTQEMQNGWKPAIA